MPDLPGLGQIKELHGALKDLAGVIPIKPFSDFEQTLISINNYAPKGAGGISKLKDQIKALGDSTVYSKQQIADLLNFYATSVNSAAVSAQKYSDIIEKVSSIGGSQEQAQKVAKIVEGLGSHSDALADLTTKGKASKEALSDLAYVYATMGTSEGNLITSVAVGNTQYDDRIKKLQRFNQVSSDTNLTLSESYASALDVTKAFDAMSSSAGQYAGHLAEVVTVLYAAKKGLNFLGFGGKAVAGVAAGRAAATGAGAVAAGAEGAGIGAGVLEALGGPIGWTALAATAGVLIYNRIKNNPTLVGGGGNFRGHGAGGSWGDSGISSDSPAILEQKRISTAINAFQDQLKKITTTFSNPSLPEGARNQLLQSQGNLAGSLGGLGVIGPQAQIRIAMDRISLLSEQQKRQESALEDAKKSGIQVDIDNAKAAINDTLNQKLGLVSMARRSYTEQMAGLAMGMPDRSFTNPGLSDRFKYGSGYIDSGGLGGSTLSPSDIRGRSAHGSYGGTYGSLFNMAAGEAQKALDNATAEKISDKQVKAIQQLGVDVKNSLGGFVSKSNSATIN